MLSSIGGTLDLLVIAKPAPMRGLMPYAPMGLAYEICRRPSDGSSRCPLSRMGADAYGGTRLQLSPGDVLKIRLINRLPPQPSAAQTQEPGHEFLNLNPTNLHLHGLLVSPRYATADDATWGDNVFVYNFNSSNGAPASGSTLHGIAIYDAVDYRIPIPLDHPSGLYWFHPHVHGITERQVTAGLSGLLTVGRVEDYACAAGSCEPMQLPSLTVRHLLLKDSQVLADGTLLTAPRSDFCGSAPSDGEATVVRGSGSCPGADRSAVGGPDFSGGRWYFTLNGQQFPTLTIGAAGELLRIVNASASASYDLNLWEPAQGRALLMQVISIDGVSIDAQAAAGAAALSAQSSARFDALPCGAGPAASRSVCTKLLHMMPSARAEVWVSYRDSSGAVTQPPPQARALLRSNGFQGGPEGERWPAIDLARVQFAPAAPRIDALSINGESSRLGTSLKISSSLRAANAEVASDPSCGALPAGHRRRIFFGSVPGLGLGLGYEEVDALGRAVPGSLVDIAPFNPDAPTVCLPLAAGNLPVTERWELVNLSGADHNFHIHQAHFSVLSPADLDTTAVPAQISGRAVVMDNLPLRHADGHCSSVSDWRNGACTTHVPVVEITFAVAGDFVYHCHILSHEDAGMMAVIRVRSSAAGADASLLGRLLSSFRAFFPGAARPLNAPIRGALCSASRQRG